MENQLHIALKTNKLFEGISIADIDLTSIKGNLFTIKEGEILYREGDPFDYIYFIVSGEMNLLSKYVINNQNSVIIPVNSFLGHDEYLNRSNRVSTVVALRDSYIIGLNSSEIEILIGQENQILSKLKENCYLNISGTIVGDNQVAEKIIEGNVSDNTMDIEPQGYEKKHSLVMNDDVDAAMVVEPENFESPDDYEEQPENFDLDNLKSDSTEERTPTTSDMEEFSLLDEKDEDIIATEPLGDALPVEELIEQDNDLFLDGISSEEEMRKIDELIQAEKGEAQSTDVSVNLETEINTGKLTGKNLESVDSSEEKNNEIREDKNVIEPEEGKIEENDFELSQIENKSEPNAVEEINDIQSENVSEHKNETIAVQSNNNEIKDNDTFNANLSEAGNSTLSTEKLDMIIKAAELVNSNIKVQDVLANIVTVAADLINADRGTLYLVEHEKGKLWSEVAMGDEIKEIHLNIGEGIAGTVAKTGEIINIEDVSVDDRFQSSFDKSSGYKTKSMLCLPIKNKEKTIVGVLQLLNSKNGKFSALDEELLNALSLFIAIALENANLVEQLLKTERIESLGKMTNFLIQDIKKPVLVSKRYADHLLEKELSPDIKQVLEMLDDQLNHVADLVQTTSSYSQGHSILRAIPTSVNEILNKFANRLESYLRTSNCTLVKEFNSDAIVKIDSKEFYQCFYQIVRNAVEAMPDGGKLILSTSVQDNKVIISFDDNGLGINESLLDKIFEPFMTYGKKNGTGLGLSITKKVIEDHGGTIGVVSTLGEGANFSITLPLANAV